MLEGFRLIVGSICLLAGVAIMIVAVTGVFRFHYVLHRMHAAAMGDTLGILFIMLGLLLRYGFSFASLKVLLIIVFFWMASPVCSHLVSYLEVSTNEKIKKECEKHND